MSPSDNRGVHPYMQRVFYTLHLFSQRPGLTEKGRRYYRSLELREAHDLERTEKEDCINWRVRR